MPAETTGRIVEMDAKERLSNAMQNFALFGRFEESGSTPLAQAIAYRHDAV